MSLHSYRNVLTNQLTTLWQRPWRTLVYVVLSGWLLSEGGCVSPKQIVYFQAAGSTGDMLPAAEPYTPTVKAGDVLSIQVSSLNPEAATFFNPYGATAAVGRVQPMTSNAVLPEMSGYLVSPNGEIELPLIGTVKVGGLTVSQTSAQIRTKLKTYLKEPTVNVRNQNFRISVMGEVMRPSLFTIPNEQISLLEALSLAGDVTIYGRRDNVLIVRESNGQKQFARVDLTRRDLFRSPYYYLHPNDVVYVEPGKARVANADRTYLLIPAILSALSFIAIIATRL